MSKRWLGIAFVLATLLFALAVYDQLPARIATHFNTEGEPDGWSSRFAVAFAAPLLAGLVIVAFHILPGISPRRENLARFEDTYWLIANVVVAFICALDVLLLGRAIGWPIDVTSATLLGIGVMFMILGNVMPRTRSNWWMGIRTPWTLESEVVWRETHRVGGRTFMAGGALTIIAALLPPGVRPWVAISALVLAGFVPVVYSYIVWRRERPVA